MECIPGNETFFYWINTYGSIVLFFLLAAGIIALPIPEETLMALSGVLMSQGHLHIPSTIAAAYLGSICGITVSYLLGRSAGGYLLKHYGHWLGVKEKHLLFVRQYGKWALLIGYFIPGVRHITGFSFGMANARFTQFALFAYTGALIWVATFLSIGYFFGEYCFFIFESIELKLDWIIISFALACLLYMIYLFRNGFRPK